MKVLCVVETTEDGPVLPPHVFANTTAGRKLAKGFFLDCVMENCGERNFGGEFRELTAVEKRHEAKTGWAAREWTGWDYTVAIRMCVVRSGE